MIYLLHGQDTVSSRNFLLRLKKQYQTATVIDVKKSKEIFELPSEQLFGQKSLIILENSVPKNADNLLPSITHDVVVWLPDSLETIPEWVGKNLLFKLSETASTFKLADLIFLGQEKQALILLGNVLQKNTAAELLIGSLVRQLRAINLVLEGEAHRVSKNSFVQSKTVDQARKWSKKKVKLAGLQLLKADLSIKKGLFSPQLIFAKLTMDLCGLANS